MVNLSSTKGSDWAPLAKNYTALSTSVANRPLAALLSHANALLPFTSATSILDNGCGPGAVTARLIADYAAEIPAACTLLCTDFSEGMLAQVEATKAEKAQDPLWQRVQASLANAMDLADVGDASQSHVLAGWVFFMTPSPQKCLAESRRVLREEGVLAVSSWQGSQWLELMALPKKVRPGIEMPAMPAAWQSAGAVAAELEKAGFRDVSYERVPTTMGFESYEGLAEMLMTKMPHMIAMLKGWSEAELAELKELILEGARGMCEAEPGSLQGTAIVAAGRK